MLSAGGSTIEIYNASGSALAFRSVVQVLPPDKALTGVGKNAWRAQTWAAGSDLGSLGMLAVVSSEQGIPDGEYGSAAKAGGVASVTIKANGTNVSQYDVLEAVTGQTYFQKWGSAQMTLTAATMSAGDLSGSVASAATISESISRLNQSVNSLRLEFNKLLTSVESGFDVIQKVRAVYVGTTLLTASDATGDVVLFGGPLGGV